MANSSGISLENDLELSILQGLLSQMVEKFFETKMTETFYNFGVTLCSIHILKNCIKLCICRSNNFQHTKVSHYLKVLPSKYPEQKLSCTLTNQSHANLAIL